MSVPHLSILVAYAWDNDHSVRKDARWSFLKRTLTSVVQEVGKRVAADRFVLDGPSRLRASAGGTLLEGIDRQLQPNAILIADITKGDGGTPNANVMFEIGMARGRGGHVFLVCEVPLDPQQETDARRPPSDLQGYYVSTYKRNIDRDDYSFGANDTAFRAAVRACILRQLREQGVWDGALDEEQDAPPSDDGDGS